MNLHETLTNRHSLAHTGSIAFLHRHCGGRLSPLRATTAMALSRRHQLLAICIAVAGLLLVPMGASAAAPAKCDWRNMLDAAANGRQLTVHTTACYKQALAHVPGDVNEYEPELRANLVWAMRRDRTVKIVRNARQSGDLRTLADAPVGASAVAPAAVRGPVTSLLEGLGPAHVDQVPTPVLALGGAAGLLLLAGLGTSLARMRQRRLTRVR
jgi:hypothetical protein